jgi:hypothetical protein
MPLLPLLLSAGLGVANSFMSGNTQNAAIRKANSMANQQAMDKYAYDMTQYDIQNRQAMSQYYWDVARTAQLRKTEKQNAVDQAQMGARLIKSAADNYRIQSAGLYDQYVTEEALRATEAGLTYNYNQNKLAAEAKQQAALYLNQVNQDALDSNQILLERNKTAQEVIGSLYMDEQRDMAEWQMTQLAGIAKSAQSGNAALQRQGGGVTAERVAIDALQALGREYVKYTNNTQGRDIKLGLLNSLNDTAANQMAKLAVKMQDSAQGIQYSLNRYGADSQYAKDQMDKLTIPTFALSSKQYGRELESLQVKTQSEFDNAQQPYREQEFFDPQAPIQGLAPRYSAPTNTPTVGMGSILANSAVSIGQSFLTHGIDKSGNINLSM